MNEIMIDENQIKSLKELFSDGFHEFILSYFKDFEVKDKALHQAIESKELDLARKIAHTLKGNSLNVGAMDLANLCTQIENASKSGNYQEVVEGYQALQKTYPSVKTAYMQLASTM